MTELTELPGCGHCAALDKPSPRVINGHEFTLDWREHQSGHWELWRWLCSCGRRGRWTGQSDSVPYHAWLKHVKKAWRQRHLLGPAE